MSLKIKTKKKAVFSLSKEDTQSSFYRLIELVSRVLYALAQQSSIFTRDRSLVQALRLCHHKSTRAGSPSQKARFKVLHRIGFTADLCYHKNW